MNTDPKPDPREDTSRPGREEEVIPNKSVVTNEDKTPDSPGSNAKPETEGERRFKEGLANNSDTAEKS